MKFGKEFKTQMVQEWQQAYMDYSLLKSLLKDILAFRQKNSAKKSQAKRVYRAFSGLTSQTRSSPKKRDEEAILVGAVKQGGSEERYQTMFLKPSDDGGDQELVFFRKLDDEFNKVLAFYKAKVEDAVSEADGLTKQMDFLIALKHKVKNFQRKQGEHVIAIEEVEMRNEGVTEEGRESHGNEAKEGDINIGSSSSLEILDRVKIKVGTKSPISMLRGIVENSSSSSESRPVSKDQLKKSEELMVQAFVEFYHKLKKLKNYCYMNQLAFSKIMKKYDKVSLRNASKPYLDMVDKSYLGSSDEVTRLMERVEDAFIKHLSNGNREKGMSALRPKQKRERHTVTFFLGIFTGISLALVMTILVLIQVRNIINDPDRLHYMENIFPLYSLFGFIILHMIMFSATIYYWRKYRVNYPFIFNLKEGTDLSYRQVFLLSSGLSVLSLAAVTTNLDMNTDPNTKNFSTIPELVPLILVGVLIIIMFCPFNIIYRSTRYFLIAIIFRCLLAPFYKVTLPDFFMADQLTSQVQAIRSVQFYLCYYTLGNFRQRNSTECLDSQVYQVFYIVVAIIPYWMRFLQCMRRLIEERRAMNAYNGFKYLSIIIAVSARTIYEQRQRQGQILMIIAASTSGIATVYATYWDVVVDWGLLQRKSRNRWLRDKLIIPNKTVYFVVIVLNCLLRLAWMQTVLGFTEAPFVHQRAMIAIVACLEIIRRGIWNFFRLENEHLNNVGKYRAFNSVPLPFYYEDEDKLS